MLIAKKQEKRVSTQKQTSKTNIHNLSKAHNKIIIDARTHLAPYERHVIYNIPTTGTL